MELGTERFQILSELGQGGMGIVYRAIDKHQGDREVALKVVRQHGAITTEQRLQFKEEFRAMARLQHPNTIQVFDYGQLDQLTQFLTMEVVSGRELSDVLLDGPTASGRAVPILIQLLQALGFIHSRGFVHRDVKAENIRLQDDGNLKLMDFGLITQLGTPATGKLTGTVGYMAPEIAKGGSINASTDLYSVGCLAYLMLTGRLPFEGSVLDVVRAHVDKDPAPLSTLIPAVPERLEAIVLRLLAKHQSDRYQDADDAIAELSELVGMRVTRGRLEHKRCYLTSSTLVGREADLRRLETGLAEAIAGQARSYFVGAPAGVGKSRLVNELILQAKLDGVTVLHGQCLESGMAPYEAVAHAVRPLVSLSTSEEIARFGPVLSKLLPELCERGLKTAIPLEATQERMRLNETITDWLTAVGSRVPLVLYLDDLHWCDPSSLEVLNHCIRSAAASRLMILATFRNDEAAPSSPLWFTIEEGHTQQLKLSPLNLPQTMQLLQAMLGDLQVTREFGAYLHQVTGGNAFFLTEVLRYLMEEGLLNQQDGVWQFPREVAGLTLPTSVGGTIGRRLEHLSDQARFLARVAAVIGRYQSLSMLLAVSGLPEEGLFKALDELSDRQFLLKEEQRYTFPHDWVRETLYETTPESDRQAIHQACAEHLEAAHPDDPAPVASELAHHFSRGSDRRKAFDYLWLAANQAHAVGVIGAAVDQWEQAEALLETLDLPRREAVQADLWWAIGSNAFEFRPASAIRSLERLIPLLETQGNSDAVCKLLRRVAGLIKRLPPRWRDRAIALLSKPIPYRHGSGRWQPTFLPSWVQRVIESYGLLGAAYSYVGKPAKGLEFIGRALDLLPFTETPLEGALLVAKGAALFAAGRMDEVAETCRQAQALIFDRDLMGHGPLLAARVGAAGYYNARCYQGYRPDEDLQAYSLHAADEVHAYGLKNLASTFGGLWRAWTGRAEEALETVERIAQNCRKIGAPPYNWTLYLRPYLAWQRGEFEEARGLIQQALGFPHLDQEVFAEQCLYVLQGHLALAMGEYEEARTIFARAEQRARAQEMALITMQALLGRGHLSLVENDHEAATRVLEEVCAMTSGGPARNPLHHALALRLLGEVRKATGQWAEAEACFEWALAIVTGPEQDNLIEQGHLHVALGDLWLLKEDKEAAAASYERARAIFQGLKNRYHQARATRRLETLRTPVPAVASRTVPPAVEVAQPRLPAGLLELAHEDFLQAVLAASLEQFGAIEASIFWMETDLRWAGSRSLAGPTSELPTNRTLLEAVRVSGSGLVTVDLPAEFNPSTNFETEIPSVLVAPILKHGRLQALLYLVKRDASQAFDEPDLQALTAWCQSLALELAKRDSWVDLSPDVQVQQS